MSAYSASICLWCTWHLPWCSPFPDVYWNDTVHGNSSLPHLLSTDSLWLQWAFFRPYGNFTWPARSLESQWLSCYIWAIPPYSTDGFTHAWGLWRVFHVRRQALEAWYSILLEEQSFQPWDGAKHISHSEGSYSLRSLRYLPYCWETLLRAWGWKNLELQIHPIPQHRSLRNRARLLQKPRKCGCSMPL